MDPCPFLTTVGHTTSLLRLLVSALNKGILRVSRERDRAKRRIRRVEAQDPPRTNWKEHGLGPNGDQDESTEDAGERTEAENETTPIAGKGGKGETEKKRRVTKPTIHTRPRAHGVPGNGANDMPGPRLVNGTFLEFSDGFVELGIPRTVDLEIEDQRGLLETTREPLRSGCPRCGITLARDSKRS
ncbi:hypothetical protein WN55_09200 [Dufourea novaeangliae]|uniref:Uncharacterized protein n=1 Tax=Dufourea novaeangliae TaxID=178035 RepID=A0A154P8N6_DUFNO|nr:hypothetical protein WN55_09200 [Dufourea novaeangliae]